MNSPTKVLADDAARRCRHGDPRSIPSRRSRRRARERLPFMAGRIAMMLAQGIAPKSIAAVTFTELAASELLIRVRDFVGDLGVDKSPRNCVWRRPKAYRMCN